MSSQLNTIIANDHYLMRESLRMILEETKKYKVVLEVGSVRNLACAVNEKSPDLILCDYYLPGGDIVEQLRNVCVNAPNATVVVFKDGPTSAGLLRQLQEIPVAGLISNESSGDEILDLLEQFIARKLQRSYPGFQKNN